VRPSWSAARPVESLFEPWRKRNLDVFAAPRPLDPRLHFPVYNNKQGGGGVDLEPVGEIGSLSYLDAVELECLVVAPGL
jgi:hypothetical protein